jgi:hypothetical protein
MQIREEITRALDYCNCKLSEQQIDQISLVFAPDRTSAEFLDPNVNYGGGRAALLRDLFSMQDLFGAFGDVSLTVLLQDCMSVVILKRLVELLSKYRQVAVDLDEVEFDVMLAVKRGNHTLDAIATYCSKSQVIIEEAVNSLCKTKTSTGISLLFVDSIGDICTEF